jgi:hypothetical protein
VAPPEAFADTASAANPLENASTLVGGVFVLVGVLGVYYNFVAKAAPQVQRPSGAAAAAASGKRSAPTIFFEGLGNLAKDPWGWRDSPIDLPKGSVVPSAVTGTVSALSPSSLAEKVKSATALLEEEEASPRPAAARASRPAGGGNNRYERRNKKKRKR